VDVIAAPEVLATMLRRHRPGRRVPSWRWRRPRVLDTRDGNGAPARAVGPGASVAVQITGRGGIPTTGVSAVVINIAVTEPTAPWLPHRLGRRHPDPAPPTCSDRRLGMNPCGERTI